MMAMILSLLRLNNMLIALLNYAVGFILLLAHQPGDEKILYGMLFIILGELAFLNDRMRKWEKWEKSNNP